MTGNESKPNGVDLAAAWRSFSEGEIDGGDGRTVVVRRPSALDLVRQGLPAILWDVQAAPDKKRKAVEQFQKELDEGGLERQVDFLEGFLAAVMIRPRLFRGDAAECPEGYVHVSHLGPYAERIFLEVLERIGFLGGDKAAAAAARFRQDDGREDGDPDSGTVRNDPGPVPGP